VRPYKAPVSLSEKNKIYRYYIRKGSVTLATRDQDERELLEMAATVPFDDRGNRSAVIDALDLGLIREYLKQVRSALFEESAKMEFIHLCRSINLADGPQECGTNVLQLRTTGIFSSNPD
jgi:ATP-dependent DNA helicase RecG